MSDPTTTPTPTNEQQDARDERARVEAWNGWIDDHRDHGSVTRELMAAWDAAWTAAVSAAVPDEQAVATVARAVLATPADWPGPDREQEWAEHIARAALAAAHAETERLRKVSAAQPYETERELAVAYDEATAMRVAAEAENERLRSALDHLREDDALNRDAYLLVEAQRDEARAALAALRQWVGLLADDLERPDASTLAVKRVVAERLRAALAAAPTDPKGAMR